VDLGPLSGSIRPMGTLTRQRPGDRGAVLKPLLAHLSDTERLVLELRFFRGATQAEIGEAIGATQPDVSRLTSRLMARLRDQLGIEERSSATGQQPAA
jgi:DNA-directed RNA polymerase specialized sigma subunit